MAKTSTYMTTLEEVADEVASWAVDQIEFVTATLAPDGRPFGMAEQSIDEQVRQYLMIRGNPEAWTHWLNDKVTAIQGRLAEAGIKPEDIAAIKPFEIAVAFGVDYSSRMEAAINQKVVANGQRR